MRKQIFLVNFSPGVEKYWATYAPEFTSQVVDIEKFLQPQGDFQDIIFSDNL